MLTNVRVLCRRSDHCCADGCCAPPRLLELAIAGALRVESGLRGVTRLQLGHDALE